MDKDRIKCSAQQAKGTVKVAMQKLESEGKAD